MIQVGLVGAGGMGTVHYHNYLHIENAQVVALVGQSPQDRDKAVQWNLPIYPTIQDMLAAQPIDILDICTPTFLHYQQVKTALDSGHSVICEKPLALSSTQARELFQLAKEKGVQLYVAQVLQFYKQSQILHGIIQSGTYGKVLEASFSRISGCPRWALGGWMFEKEKSGLVPFDLHIHDLDLIVSLFGPPRSHSYVASGAQDKSYTEHYRFTYSYEDFNVTAEAGWLNADGLFVARWCVYFEEGVVINENGIITAYQPQQEPYVFDTKETVLIPTGINLPPTGTFLAELTHFLDCFAKNQPSGIVGARQVVEVIRILENIVYGNPE